MTDTSSTGIAVVRGEMQPWSDATGPRTPAGGPVLTAFLADLLPPASHALVLGPHGRDVVEAVAARSTAVTVLLRSVSDATELHAALAATNVRVVAGALDGLADEGGPAYDLVVAADGLDRVLGADSPEWDWPRRAAALAGLTAPDATVVVGLGNEFALTDLLDRRPARDRHGDDEWRPLHDDPARPVSPGQFRDALAARGLHVTALYASFDVAGTAHTLLDVDAATAGRPGHPAVRLAVRALEAAAARQPLLAPVAEGADNAARAGLLGAVAPGWLAVCGAGAPRHTAYADAGDGLLVADRDGGRWRVTVTGGGVGAGALAPLDTVAEVPDTETVERRLLRLAAAEDLPGFRRVAARLGDWARTDGAGLVARLDDTGIDGDTLTRGLLAWRTAEPATPAELLAAAWHRFRDRLIGGHHRHPWPPWLTADDLVTMWLGMSGEEADAAALARGRRLADAVAAAVDAGLAEVDLRAVLADAEAARVRSVELAGHVAGLERTIRFRDQQLKARENRLRALRSELRALKGSRAGQLAEAIRKVAVIRDPKRVARAVKRRLR
ncbi:hypothetical protein [Micromonospora costi]|uniref:Class I SAM-dependent methyltransferase n=1 Tax=Micromonospora costi TaxID=1530042 RepID=A0A3A9ZUU1_9ACTN|nr:hypothetical protein [Micromonospora costi]RKN51714.1 hypothetical protein D7193_27690 [Micromonospora costi]